MLECLLRQHMSTYAEQADIASAPVAASPQLHAAHCHVTGSIDSRRMA